MTEFFNWYGGLIQRLSSLLGINIAIIFIISLIVIGIAYKMTKNMISAGVACAFVIFVVVIANEMGFIHLW